MVDKFDVTLSADDAEDILAALDAYEEDLDEVADGSAYVAEVLCNIDSLRDRIAAALRRGMH